MGASITDSFRDYILDKLYSDFTNRNRALGDSDYFYIGIGRSENWPNDSDTVVGINSSNAEELKFRLSMQSLKLVNDASYIVDRYNWSSGSIYSGYDNARFASQGIDVVVGRYPTYVYTSTQNVFICLKQGRNSLGIAVPSTVEPSDITGTPFETGDGYVWQYLYNIGSFEANRYLSSNFLPVQLVDSAEATTPAEIDQLAKQKLAVAGQIVGIAIDSGGNGYLSAPTLTITGNGQNAEASCIISGGKIVDVFMKRDPDSDFNVARLGSGYNYADVSVSSGTASLRAIIAKSKDGIGADPRQDLNSRGIMFNVKPDGTENGDFIVDQSFRQVGLLLNPLRDSAQYAGFTGDSAFTQSTGSSLNYLQLVGDTFSSNPVGEEITGGTSGAVAYVDDYNSTNFRIKFHQTVETGFKTFQEGEVITTPSSGSATLEAAGVDADDRAFALTDIDKLSGDLLYIDNRAAIQRDVEQTEDIKIVIQI